MFSIQEVEKDTSLNETVYSSFKYRALEKEIFPLFDHGYN